MSLTKVVSRLVTTTVTEEVDGNAVTQDVSEVVYDTIELSPGEEAAVLAEWALADPASFANRKVTKRTALDVQADTANTTPFAWDFGATAAKTDTGADAGEAGAQTLQCRGVEDEKNWLAVTAAATLAIMSGAPTTVIPIKVTSNVWVQATAAQLVQALVTGDGTHASLLTRQSTNLAVYGALKTAIEAAGDQAALDAIDITQGWPS